jgi:hypothetical protein
MKQSEIFLENAENCLQLAERARGMPAFRRYSRMARAWTALAHEQDWLDGEIPPCAAHEAGRSRDDDQASENGDIIGHATDDEI